jgi:4-amino-4-deoxy-L-arabinose transferase-like glycosyltransferase
VIPQSASAEGQELRRSRHRFSATEWLLPGFRETRFCGILASVSRFTSSRSLSQRQQDALALLLILGVAALLRVWQIDRFPPGLFGDEAVNGLDALDALAGRPQVFFPANFGREGLHILIQAQFIRWLGATPLALRLPSIGAGVITALATYWLGRELLARTRWRGALTPLVAALLLSTSYWHVHFSRFGIRGVFTPLLATLAFAAFWRAANRVADNRRAWPWFLAAGLFLGLGVHFYTASRLIPIFLGVYLVVQWAGGKVAGRRWQVLGSEKRRDGGAGDNAGEGYPPLLGQALWPLVGMAVTALLAFAPLGLHFLRTPGSLTQRASAVSLLNPEIGGDNPLARLAQAAVANVAQFFWPGAGDQAQFYNLSGRPVFDPLLALLAGAGMVICAVGVWRWLRGPRAARTWRPAEGSALLFLLLWFPALLVPTMLAVDRFPTLPRALGVLPGVYFYPAIALVALAQRVRQRWLAALLIIAVVAWHGALTWRDYFQRWAPAPETFDAFEGDIAAAASWLATHPAEEVYLSADIYRHPTFAFLHAQTPLTEIFDYQDSQVHFFDGRSSLPLPPAGRPAVYLFTHNAGPDPLLSALPGWPGFASQEQVAGPGGPALTMARLDGSALSLSDFDEVDIPFGANVRMTGYRLEPQADGSAAIYLLWQMAAPEPGQWASLQVQAGLATTNAGQQMTQASSEFAYRATEWAPSSRALSWLRLPQAATAPTGSRLAVRLINQGTGLPLESPQADTQGWVLLPLD